MDTETVNQASRAITPFMEYGFCGLAFLLIVVGSFFLWRQQNLDRERIQSEGDRTKALDRQTAALGRLADALGVHVKSNYDLRDEIIRRPCVASSRVKNPSASVPTGSNIMDAVESSQGC